jgi:prophage tail gpP-like protein
MSKPTPGQKYTVVKGDTLWGISARAYGDPRKWPSIFRANSSSLRSGNANLIYPGEVLYIPGDTEVKKVVESAKVNRYASKPKGSFTLVLDGREVPADSIQFKTGLTHPASTWVATIPWKHGVDPWLDEKTRRGSYTPGQLYIGSELVGTGKLYKPHPKVTKSSSSKSLEFSSATADLVDSNMVAPYEFGGINLKVLATEYLGSVGYVVVCDCNPGPKFDSVKGSRSEKIGAFLTRLAAQRGMLVTDDEFGRVVFLKAATTGAPVFNFEEGRPPLEEFEADFDDRKRFHVYAAMGGSGDGSAITSIVRDPSVPGIRFLAIGADDVDVANVKNSAEWRRSKALADAYSQPITVPDWYDANGNLWRKNSLVTMLAPSLDLPKRTTLLIKDVELRGDKNARSATLEICPPFALAGGEIPEEWK